MRKLQQRTVDRLQGREKPRSRQLSDEKYGVLAAVPHAFCGLWCCPEHGRMPNTVEECRRAGLKPLWSQEPISKGVVLMKGPVVVYATKGARGRPYVRHERLLVSWQEFVCPWGNHVIRMHYHAGSRPTLKVVPGNQVRFYTPEPHSEYYPALESHPVLGRSLLRPVVIYRGPES